MPTVEAGKKVLVTGASGFVAAWIVKTLLEKGYYVRGTVRSTSKGDYLTRLFKDHSDRFQYVVVEDMAKVGAFDEAVKGMDAVEHPTSPFHYKVNHPDELIVPSVHGTIGLLESILEHGSTVKRVVITSSGASVARFIPITDKQKTFTEDSWNDFSVNEVASKGIGASGPDIYCASKVLAEKGAWEFMDKNKSVGWDVTVLNPSLVLGPSIHEVPTAGSLNTSLVDLYALIKGKISASPAPVTNYVDVRDLAAAHVRALTSEKAGGERFLMSAGPFTWQDVLDAVHSGPADPELSSLPKGAPGAGKDATHLILLNTTKARSALGVRFKDFEETVKDTVKSLLRREKELGW